MTELLKHNAIYNYLLQHNENSFIGVIDTTFQTCEDILKYVPKFFSNYTQHDINHSIRDIDYMTEFVKDNLSKYSDLHLAMIILSGLLHDVGMFINDDEIKELETRFSSPDTPVGSDELRLIIQKYVRENHGKRVKKIVETTEIDKSTHALFKSIFVVGKSYNYADTLFAICQSHCENVEWVVENISDTYEIADFTSNPQQIAFLLRIGDGLDIDDRRAPAYLEKLLSVKGYSATEWAKHTPITNYNKIKKNAASYTIRFAGKCDDADIYRKVMDYISYIECDLKKLAPIIRAYEEPYKININDVIERNITTIGFEPTELIFQLDYKKVVTLLMGENIYGDKQSGLRELIQNSIDAVLAMKERFSTANSNYNTYSPQVIVELKKDTNEFIVYDNGIGMTEEVLTKYFFQIGNSYYTSNEFKEFNPHYKAIGQYGIGFLACFMLSKKVTLETKSHLNSDSILMDFDKNSSFVTKRRTTGANFQDGHGTRITLRYDEIIGSVFVDEIELKNYIESLLLTDGYSLKIFLSDSSAEIQKTLNDAVSSYISVGDMDICYKINRFPDMISSISQMVEDGYTTFYYWGKDDDYENLADTFVSVDYLLEAIDDIDENADIEDPDTFDDVMVQGAILSIFQSIEKSDTPLRDDVEQKLLSMCYNNGELTYIRVPFISDKSALKSFQANANENGYYDALETFDPQLSYFNIIGSINNIPNKVLDEMIETAIDLCDGDASYYDNYVEYDESKFIPELVNLAVKKSPDGTFYLPIEKNFSLQDKMISEKIYMHGINVRDAHLVLPQVITGTDFEKIFINVHSPMYSLEVSRNKLNEHSMDKLGKRASQLIYDDLLKRNSEFLNQTEISTISDFISSIS